MCAAFATWFARDQRSAVISAESEVPLAITTLPTELTDRGSRRELPLPTGWDRDRVFELLQTISIEGAPSTEIEGYLREDFERFLITWDLVRDKTGRVLEIGANPYFTTVLLCEFTDLDITITNSFDPNSTAMASQRVAYASASDRSVGEHVFEYHSLNVETAVFPFELRVVRRRVVL